MERTRSPSPQTGNQPEKPPVDSEYPPSTRPERYSQELTRSPYPAQLAHPPQHSSQPGMYPPPYPGLQHGPPQHLEYSSPQGRYPCQNRDVYYHPQQVPPPQHQTTTGVVVVRQQPTAYTVNYIRAGDHYRTFSIFVCVLCCLCGSPLTLCCTIPAIFTASQARDAEKNGDRAYAADRDHVTIALNVVAIIFGSIVLALNLIRYFFISSYE